MRSCTALFALGALASTVLGQCTEYKLMQRQDGTYDTDCPCCCPVQTVVVTETAEASTVVSTVYVTATDTIYTTTSVEYEVPTEPEPVTSEVVSQTYITSYPVTVSTTVICATKTVTVQPPPVTDYPEYPEYPPPSDEYRQSAEDDSPLEVYHDVVCTTSVETIWETVTATEVVTVPTTIENTITLPGETIVTTLPASTVTITKDGTTITSVLPGTTVTATLTVPSKFEVSLCPQPTGRYERLRTDSDLTFGCKPGFVCDPPKPNGCNMWPGPPSRDYVCEPQHCIRAPPYKEIKWEKGKTGYLPPQDGYFVLNPEAFGLSWEVFEYDVITKVHYGHTKTITTGNWESQATLSEWPRETPPPYDSPSYGEHDRRSLHWMSLRDVTPPICMDDCTNAWNKAESIGKDAELLCVRGPGGFLDIYDICINCIIEETDATPETVREYVEEEFQQWVGFCDGQGPPAETPTSATEPDPIITTTATVTTGPQIPPTNTNTFEPVPPTTTTTTTTTTTATATSSTSTSSSSTSTSSSTESSSSSAATPTTIVTITTTSTLPEEPVPITEPTETSTSADTTTSTSTSTSTTTTDASSEVQTTTVVDDTTTVVETTTTVIETVETTTETDPTTSEEVIGSETSTSAPPEETTEQPGPEESTTASSTTTGEPPATIPTEPPTIPGAASRMHGGSALLAAIFTMMAVFFA